MLKLFIRNDNPHTCKAKKKDFDRFAQVSGKRGSDAEKELSDFIATVVNKNVKNVNDMQKVRQCRIPPIHITEKEQSSIPSNRITSRNRTKSPTFSTPSSSRSNSSSSTRSSSSSGSSSTRSSSSVSKTPERKVTESVRTPPTPQILKVLLGIDTESLFGMEDDQEFLLEEEKTNANKENKRKNEMSDANENEKDENDMSVMKGKKVNDVEKKRVRDERLEVKRDISKKTDSIVLKQTVIRKKESNNDVRSRGMEMQSRLKELQQLQNSKIMLNVGGCKMETSQITFAIESSEHCCSTNNVIFIDRDPTHMRFILNYLCYNGSMPEAIIPRDRRNLTEILHEAEYYNLKGLSSILWKRLNLLLEWGEV
ncbi:hypothetical protein ACJMK2_024311 [Sinanodonta woodiana]|uniref:Potassium channel tetramerisation-type BTB domain-containing protein n=1 Tax=Sinanodonta woodiana TaxID=1069815 RepID=A0ABD3T7W2_SINWO